MWGGGVFGGRGVLVFTMVLIESPSWVEAVAGGEWGDLFPVLWSRAVQL